jgi:hypothetical protein
MAAVATAVPVTSSVNSLARFWEVESSPTAAVDTAVDMVVAAAVETLLANSPDRSWAGESRAMGISIPEAIPQVAVEALVAL